MLYVNFLQCAWTCVPLYLVQFFGKVKLPRGKYCHKNTRGFPRILQRSEWMSSHHLKLDHIKIKVLRIPGDHSPTQNLLILQPALMQSSSDPSLYSHLNSDTNFFHLYKLLSLLLRKDKSPTSLSST